MRVFGTILAAATGVLVTSSYASAMGTIVEYSNGSDPLVPIYAILQSLPFSSLLFY